MKTSLLAALLFSTAVLAADRRPVLAVLPPAAPDPAGRELALMIQARTTAMLTTSNKYSEVHLKQILAMAGREGLDIESLDPKLSDRAAKLLGAERVAWGALEHNDKGYKLKAVTTDLKRLIRVEVQLGSDLAKAVEAAATSLSHAMLKIDDISGFKSPPAIWTKSDAAMQAYSHCYATVVRQPMGIENPAVLDSAELEIAIGQCKEAVAADPKFAAASAALGLAYAIVGNDAEAVKALAPIQGADLDQPLYWIARFWEVTRYQSNEAGEGLLREAISKRPDFLLARSYLGELLDVLGKYDKSEAAWREYLAAAPADPYVMGRLGKSLARQNKHPEAITTTQQALALEPKSREMRLQLASRHIDAGKVDDALPLLTALADEPDARGEAMLRLGWAYWLKGSPELAQPWLEKAITRAKSPADWRTRGRAQYDLALVYAKKGDAGKTESSLKAAILSGYRVKDVDPSLTKAVQKLEKQALSLSDAAPVARDGGAAPKTAKGSKDAPTIIPREVSLFPVDKFGDVAPATEKPPPPEGFMVVHF
jgi:tetratricopeptide (TPR) repeat protein